MKILLAMEVCGRHKGRFDLGMAKAYIMNAQLTGLKVKKRKYKCSLKNLQISFQSLYIQMGYDDGNGNWIEESDNKSMPIFVNYGVNRIVLDVPVRAPKEQFVKLDAFDKAIESTIDFRIYLNGSEIRRI